MRSSVRFTATMSPDPLLGACVGRAQQEAVGDGDKSKGKGKGGKGQGKNGATPQKKKKRSSR